MADQCHEDRAKAIAKEQSDEDEASRFIAKEQSDKDEASRLTQPE